MTPALLREWLLAFVLTQAIEAPLYARFALSGARRLPRALVPSALTHPVVWFVIPPLWAGSYAGLVAVCEVFAVIAEAAALRVLGARRPLAWSLAANAASLAVGMALYRLRGLL